MYACYDSLYYYQYEEESYGDAIADLYKLNDEMSYLIMGRIDLGVNYEGWSLDETKQYLTEQGMDAGSADELYYTLVGDPAVYQSYAFDVKEFNTIILETGPCQYDILKKQIDKKLQGNVI